MIPYGRQDIDEADIAEVVQVLRSDWLTQGPTIERFERAVAEYCGAAHAVAVCNATAALHLACRALGLGPADILWTSPNTFVASANCALYCGASVDFVDIDPHSYNMSVSALAEKLRVAERAGKLPRIVVPVHFGGQACAMAEVAELAARYGFRIIEDASHAVGGEYRGERIGNCRYSDVAVFSFHPVKIMTTAEGGMLLTNDRGLYDKLRRLRTHGITREAREMANGRAEGGWYYEQIDLGYNYRMTDIQAALGITQLRRLDRFLTRRRELAARYDLLLADLPLTRPWQHPDSRSSFHLYPIRLDLVRIGKTRGQIFDELRAGGIGVHVHYIPVHRQPFYRYRGFNAGDFPVAESYYEQALSLPLHYRLTNSDQDRVVGCLRRAISA